MRRLLVAATVVLAEHNTADLEHLHCFAGRELDAVIAKVGGTLAPRSRLGTEPWLCPNPAILEAAQAALPCASRFVDVGGNKGFTAMLFLALWRPSLGASPWRWYDAHVRHGLWPNTVHAKHTMCGSCHACLQGGRAGFALANCTTGPPPIEVHSFDGSLQLVDAARDFVRTFGHEVGLARSGRLNAVWSFHHLAISSERGEAKFIQGSSEVQSLLLDDDEAAIANLKRIGGSDASPNATQSGSWSMVQQTTLDAFASGRGWPDSAGPDVIKVDAEGFDGLVLRGAARVLRRASLVLFEYNPIARVPLRSMLEQLEGARFRCFLAGVRGLVRVGAAPACWSDGLEVTNRTSWTWGGDHKTGHRWIRHTWSRPGDRTTEVPSLLFDNTNLVCASERNAPDLVHRFNRLVRSTLEGRGVKLAAQT